MIEKDMASEVFEKVKNASNETEAVISVIECIANVKADTEIDENLFRSELNSLLRKTEEAKSNAQILENIRIVYNLLQNEEKIANELYEKIKSAKTGHDAIFNYFKGTNNLGNRKGVVDYILNQYFKIPLTSWKDFQATSNIYDIKEVLDGDS